MAKDDIRAFIAIELPEDVKRFLERISSKLKKCGADVGWVRIENIHLTLKFLGSVSPDLIPSIEESAAPVFAKQTPIHLSVKGLGVFPGMRSPRVVWTGCVDAAKALAPLVAELEESLESLGFPKEKRPFSPHLTLGRVRSNKRVAQLVEELRQNLEVAGPEFTADHAALFQSLLKPTGAEYRALRSFDFARHAR
jgi:RNA 2',3'-cyclic 3'-phosphodiesterase